MWNEMNGMKKKKKKTLKDGQGKSFQKKIVHRIRGFKEYCINTWLRRIQNLEMITQKGIKFNED